MRSKASIRSHPIHPMLVTFPLGLWIAGFIFDLLTLGQINAALRAAGFYCVIAGCIGAVAAAVPGVLDWLLVIPPQSSGKRTGLWHGSLNVLALVLFISVAWRQGGPDNALDEITFTLMALGVIVIGISGWLGGTLVYRNQIGVEHLLAGAGTLKTRTLSGWDQPVCNQSELSDGQMMMATIGGKRVVVGRCADGLFAFSNHCTHHGGPLADGALVGCTVQCPWHGSQFDIRTGRVVAGPAEDGIRVFATELRGGEVYVKPLKTPQVMPKKVA